ncbi:hypothetical protein RN001_000509 [Aquatica leii]|uniref:Uncharacterized protein n=1 Tax=Aquatica leii TaxID=1421715 RepID=A0AAN7QM26_9COLE|nr:hypothetical protein RN001_000509 [Aquatica leii]
MYKNVTIRKSNRLPLVDKSNLKVKKCLKKTNVPCKTNSIIKSKEVLPYQVPSQRKEKDLKSFYNVFVRVSPCKELENRLVNEKHDSKNMKMNLRKRKVQDYINICRDSSDADNEETHKKHVPIYLKKIKSKEPTKITDPFKFTDDSSKNKANDNTDSDSSTFEKSMQEILKEITRKERKPKTLRKKTIKKNFKTVNQPLSQTNVIKNNLMTNINDGDVSSKQTDVISTPNQALSKFDIVKDKAVDANDGINVKSSTSTSTNKNVDVSLVLESPKRINVISNVLIQASQNIPSPTHSCSDSYEDINYFEYDNAVSSTPWRGDDLNLRRNPHWLALKSTCLPFYNQEMILQPDLLEKSVANTTILKENSYVQTDISDYMTGKLDNSFKVNNTSSLFDEHNLSPLKRTERRRNSNKVDESNLLDENSSSPIKNKSRSSTIKRNILGSLTMSQVPNSVQKVHSYYNFSFIDDENKENVPRQFKNKKKHSAGLPMRVSITDVQKIQKEAAEKLSENIVVNESLNDSLPIVETSDCGVQIGLFEDLESETIVKRTYESKKRRRARFASVEVNEAFEEKKKKKKTGRSKAEEKAFNDWANSFNAMCKEVEQHHLEIEPI